MSRQAAHQGPWYHGTGRPGGFEPGQELTEEGAQRESEQTGGGMPEVWITPSPQAAAHHARNNAMGRYDYFGQGDAHPRVYEMEPLEGLDPKETGARVKRARVVREVPFKLPNGKSHEQDRGYYPWGGGEVSHPPAVLGMGGHTAAAQPPGGCKEEGQPGERPHFEYHCLESDDSNDAELWHRSHQQVEVLHRHPRENTGGWEGSTFAERTEEGAHDMYHIRFGDGHEGDVFEDELVTHPKHFYRPDPPPRLHTAAAQPGLEYHHLLQGKKMAHPFQSVMAAHDGEVVGHLSWGPGNPDVQSLWVHPDYRHRGVATALWGHAQALDKPPQHSLDRSDAGDAWARSVTPDVADRKHSTSTDEELERRGQASANVLTGRLQKGDDRHITRIAARPRIPRGSEACGCCNGTGEHSDGHECYRCDASGYVPNGSREPYCPGQNEPKRRHWREGALDGADGSGYLYHSGAEHLDGEEWVHLGTEEAARNRAKDWIAERARRGDPEIPVHLHTVELRGSHYPSVRTDTEANDPAWRDIAHRGGHDVLPYTNEYEDPGTVSYLARPSAVHVVKTQRIAVRGEEHTAAMADDEVPPVVAHFEVAAMAWNNEHGDKGKYTPVSVRDAGFAGLVGDSEDERSLREELGEPEPGHRDPWEHFDEDLHDHTAPEPTEEERREHEEDGESESYTERHDQAYENAFNDRERKIREEDAPDHEDPGLRRFREQYGSDTELWKRHGAFGGVSLRQPIYATQSHVAKEHIEKYTGNRDAQGHAYTLSPDRERIMHSMGREYLGDKHPLFVTHEGRVHVIEGHHRVATDMATGRHETVGWHFNLDKHPALAEENEGEYPEGYGEDEPAGHRRTAAMPGDYDAESAFGDYTLRHRTEDQGERKPRHIIEAYAPDGSIAGRLNWYGTSGVIHHIEVAREEDDGQQKSSPLGNGQNHQRRGLATAMWNWGREIHPKLRHSGDRTPQGVEWAKAVGGPGLRSHKGSAKQEKTAVVEHFATGPATMSVQDLLGLHSSEALRRERGKAGKPVEHSDATTVHTLYDRKAAEMAQNEPAWSRLDEPIRNGTIDPVLLESSSDGHTVVTEGGHRIVRAHQLGVPHLPVSYDPGSQAHRYEWDDPEPLEPKEAASPADYGIGHRPMEIGAPMHDLTGEAPDADFDRTSYNATDYLTAPPRYYSDTGENNNPEDREAIAQMKRVQGKPDALVDIYRATHKDAPHEINRGDWVTLSKGYAEKHAYAESGSDDPEAQYRVHHARVPAKHVRDGGGGGYREQGYWGPSTGCCDHHKSEVVAHFEAEPTAEQQIPYMRPPGPGAETTEHILQYHTGPGQPTNLSREELGLHGSDKHWAHWHLHEHRGRIHETHQHLGPVGTPGETHWPDTFEPSEHYYWGNITGERPVGFHPENYGGFHPLAPAEGALVQHFGEGSHPTGISHEELDARLEGWFHPQKLEADKVTHPVTGWGISTGKELRVSRPPEGPDGPHGLGPEGPAEFDVWHHPGLDRSQGMFARKTGTEPIQHVYRGVSAEEWQQAQQRGYLSSDQRGTISSAEGTNAAVDPRSAVSYLPGQGAGHVLKIRVHPDEHWFTIRSDNYLRTRHPIPLSRVENVSPQITKGGKYNWINDIGPEPQQHTASAGELRAYCVGPPRERLASAEWFHGSEHPEPFERFDFGKERPSGYADEGSGARWWNSRLGAHFTTQHTVASELSSLAQYGKKGLEGGGPGHVYHVDLDLKNPKHYKSEHHLDQEAHHWAQANGFVMGAPSADPRDTSEDLQTHDQGQEIAEGFRRHLQDQGHDSITYGNEWEGAKGHLCAIAFHPGQAKIRSTHGTDAPCDQKRPCPNCHIPAEREWDHCLNCDHPLKAENTHKMAAAQVLAALENPYTHHSIWYHGTQADPADIREHGLHDASEFAHGRFEVPESETDDSGHWNAMLGVHFTADHEIAGEFARGEHEGSDNEGYGGEEEDHHGIIHARVHLKNPKFYDSEHDLDHDAYQHEFAAGNHPQNHHPGLGKHYEGEPDFDDPDVDERLNAEEMWPHAHRIAQDYGREEIPASTYGHHGSPFDQHPMRTAWLNTHPDKYGIAMRHKKRLMDQGYDGVVYRNEYERSNRGGAANTSIIAFHPDKQVEITQHHDVDEAHHTDQGGDEHLATLGAMEEAQEVVSHFAAAAGKPAQLKMFHWPHQRQPCPECGYKLGGDEEDQLKHIRHVTDDYEPATCEHCGGDENLPREHAEQHHDWLTSQDWYTDWDHEGPGDTIHRGFGADLPDHVHAVVHDQSLPVKHRAQVLMKHLLSSDNVGGAGVGNFWSGEPDVSKTYAESYRRRFNQQNEMTPVMLHAHTPDREHFETDPDTLQDWGVYSYHNAGNREVPLQNQAPVRIKGVSWAPPGHRDREHSEWEDQGKPGLHHLGQDPAWVHHEVGGEGIRAHATVIDAEAQARTDADLVAHFAASGPEIMITASEGPFYHGSRSQFQPGDMLTVKGANEHAPNYSESTGRHLFFTDTVHTALDYAEPRHDSRTEVGHIYEVRPTSRYHPDPAESLGYSRDPSAYRTDRRLQVVRELGPEDMSPEHWARLRVNEIHPNRLDSHQMGRSIHWCDNCTPGGARGIPYDEAYSKTAALQATAAGQYIHAPEGSQMWQHLQEAHGVTAQGKTPGESFMSGLHDRFHAGQVADRRLVVHHHEAPAPGAPAQDSFINHFFTPAPSAPKPAYKPEPERLDDNEYSLGDVSRRYDWEGFDKYEIEHLVARPEHATFTREDVPVHSLRQWAPGGKLKKPITYKGIARQGKDERDRLAEVERGMDQGAVPPIVVVRDGEHHIIADGSHRSAIAAERGHSHIEAFVTDRTKRDGEHTAVVAHFEDDDHEEWERRVIPPYAGQPLMHGTRSILHPGELITREQAAEHPNNPDIHAEPFVHATTSGAEAHEWGGRASSASADARMHELGRQQPVREGYNSDHAYPPRVYQVEPTGPVEPDPHKEGASYRSAAPMRVVREVRPLSCYAEECGNAEHWPDHPHYEFLRQEQEEDEDPGGSEHTAAAGPPSFAWEHETYGPQGDYVTKHDTVEGPFYHGGRANLRPGGMIKPGQRPNSWGDTFDERGRSVHTYFAHEPETAAAYARETGGHMYEVEPTGRVTYDGSGGDGSWRSEHPLRVIRKIPPAEWDSLPSGRIRHEAQMVVAEKVADGALPAPAPVSDVAAFWGTQSDPEPRGIIQGLPGFFGATAASLDALAASFEDSPAELLAPYITRMADACRNAEQDAAEVAGRLPAAAEGVWTPSPEPGPKA